MKTLIIQKIKNKKVLNICLLLGITLLIAIFSCTPMFLKGSLDKLLITGFEKQFEETNEYPMVISKSASILGENISYNTVDDILNKYKNTWEGYIDIPSIEFQKHIWATAGSSTHLYGNNKEWVNFGCIPTMEEHVNVLAGSLDEECSDAYPCYITDKVMDAGDYTLGDVITSDVVKDSNGNQLKFKIVAIVEEKSDNTYFWNAHINSFEKHMFVSEDKMKDILANYNISEIKYEIYDLLDYRKVDCNNVSDISYYLKEFHAQDKYFVDNVTDLLPKYFQDKKFVITICWVLELPIIILLLGFIYMVVNQILGMETGEISMFTSRGFKRFQVMKIYLGQALILSLFGCILGLPLGYLLCKIAASTNGFLDFTIKDVSNYHARWLMLPFALIGAVVSILFITIPVLFYAKDTIIERKSKKNNKNNRKLMVQLGLYLGLLFVSLYLLLNYKKQRDLLAMDVMLGKSLDPLIFINVSIFLLACGLLGLKLIHGIVNLVYKLGKNKWKPHTYASLLQILRGGSKSQFIAVFLIITVSMGIVDANIAGTINVNNEERICYNIGADFVFAEKWSTSTFMDSVKRLAIRYYEEPDYQRYEKLLADEVEQMTRVVRDDSVSVHAGKKSVTSSMIAIKTKEFGEVADLKEGLNDTHWYNLLNELAKNPVGVLVSSNLAENLDLEVGSPIMFTRYDRLNGNGNNTLGDCSGVVVGIYDAMPSLEMYSCGYFDEEYKEISKYGIIVNYAYEVNACGDTPYEIWMRLKEGTTTRDIIDKILDAGIKVDFYKNKADALVEFKNSPVIQITNGLFTLSFMISLILCTAGFLIYWITSIKQRELLFGIYRAMGMSFKEVNGMLLLEQLLSSLLSGILGGLTGMLASLLHIKVISVVYLPEKHNIALHTVIDGMNLTRFLVLICVMIVVCLMVMRNQIKKLNMVQAIKMGED